MKTLSRAITARFFPNPDSFNALHKHWSSLINSERKHELMAAHHLLYLAMMGKDWRKAFTPPTNQRKLDNGAFFGWRMFRALRTIHCRFGEEEWMAPFEGLITPQILSELRRLFPTVNADFYKPTDFVNGTSQFDAYSEGDSMKIMIHFKKDETNA